ncbi:MAG: MgtC/SapB family protein [Chloroherpetonaceae bacterium]|nr:MgtC/SapB family protein [Chthonomonadaceae bacterium]MDW8207900.1 MgtC/SapB family protein [Chloroherpetonaceae bacterium]
MTYTDFIVRVLCSLLFGAIIGLERQWRQRIAGLRTNTLVCMGACLFVILGMVTPHENSPTRIAAQVVSGIGFLGAGVIMRNGLNVTGLNTAATLWCAAAVGVLSGAGHLAMAATGAVSVLAANVLLRPVAHRIMREKGSTGEVMTCYRVRVVCRAKQEQHIRSLLLQGVHGSPMRLRSLHSEDADAPDRLEVRAEMICPDRCDVAMELLVARLSLEQSVSAIRWEVVAEEEL